MLTTISSVMHATVKDSENRMARAMYKLAVETSKLSHVIAYSHGVDEQALRKLQAKCAEEVKRINGAVRGDYRRQGRKSMVILVDTNIIIDALANREPYADDAKRIMEKCAAREITGILAAHSIPNLFYILRKNFSQEERRFLLKNLCEIFQISDLNEKKIVAALENNAFSDFEDGLQEECAVEAMADYIVTRNPADFKHSRVKVILPDELLRELEKKLIIRREYRTITSVVVFSVLLKAVNL